MKTLIIAIGLSLVSVSAWAGCTSTNAGNVDYINCTDGTTAQGTHYGNGMSSYISSYGQTTNCMQVGGMTQCS